MKLIKKFDFYSSELTIKSINFDFYLFQSKFREIVNSAKKATKNGKKIFWYCAIMKKKK